MTKTATERNKKRTRAVMRRAWTLYRATVAGDPAAKTRATFIFCLRHAWEENRQSRRAADEVRAQWEALEPAAQLDTLRRMASKAASNYTAKTSGVVAWGHIELDDIASGAYIAMAEALDNLEETNDTRTAQNRDRAGFGTVLYNAAYAALLRLIRDDIKSGCEMYDPNANEPAADDTARAAMLRAAFDEIKDPQSRAILAMYAEKNTVRQIAAALDISPATVSRRLQAIREHLESTLAA